MTIAHVRADHYRIPLPVTLSDSTHGEISHFEPVTVRIHDAEGAEGLGTNYTVGAGGAAIHALLTRDPTPLLMGQGHCGCRCGLGSVTVASRTR